MNQSTPIVLAVIFGSIIIAGGIYFGLANLKEDTANPSTQKSVNYANDTQKNEPNVTAKSQDASQVQQESPQKQPSQKSNKTKESDSNDQEVAPQKNRAPDITFTKSELVKALSDATYIDEDKVNFSVGDQIKEPDKILLRGTVIEEGAMDGAEFFAVVDKNGINITFVGQGVPDCKDVNPYGYPKSWMDYCIDENGNTVER